jgi:hypothetical protein
MSEIKFVDDALAGNRGGRGTIYLSVVANQGGEDLGLICGYVRPEVISLVKTSSDLLEALQELLEAETNMMPSYEAGKDAQDAWAARIQAARNNARAVIAKATTPNEFTPNPARRIDGEIDEYLR